MKLAIKDTIIIQMEEIKYRKYEDDPTNLGNPGPAVWECFNKPTNRLCVVCNRNSDNVDQYYFCTCCGTLVHRGCAEVMEHCNRITKLGENDNNESTEDDEPTEDKTKTIIKNKVKYHNDTHRGIYAEELRDKNCVICSINMICCTLEPCMHMCLCMECAGRLEGRKCPICHEVTTAWIYDSTKPFIP
jgi:hypothetical protein